MEKSKRKLFLSLFIVFIMVSSTLGFIYGFGQGGNGVSSSKKYNGYTFTQTQSGWSTYIPRLNSYQSFNYLPNEVENIGSVNIESDFVYIVDNGNIEYSNRLKNILTYSGIVSQTASFDKDSTLPLVDCTSNFPVIVLNKESQTTEVYKENNCIFVNGNLNKGVDFLAYTVFGIIK